MPVISIATLKGGTAKTTTAINLAAALRRKGYTVLLVDSDPQANLTYALSAPAHAEHNLYTEYKKELSGQPACLRDAMVDINPGISLIPSSIYLGNAEQELVSKFAREHTLRKRMLKPVVNDFDFIFIDCPPSFGMLTVNALVASDYIIIPVQGEFLPQKGAENFLVQLEALKEALNLEIRVAGFLLTRFSPRKKINAETKSWLEEAYPGKVFENFIHTDIKLAAAQKKGVDIFTYAPLSAGAADYENLADEFLKTIAPEEPATTGETAGLFSAHF